MSAVWRKSSETPRRAGDDLTRLGGATTSTPAGAVGVQHQPEWTPGRTWRIAMPARQQLLNANDRPNRYARARIVKQLRRDGFLMAKHAKVPLLEHARIDCFYEPAVNRDRDAANWADSAKPIVDGFVDAGLLRDDSSDYLDGPFMHIGAKHPGGRLVFVITELTRTGTPHEH